MRITPLINPCLSAILALSLMLPWGGAAFAAENSNSAGEAAIGAKAISLQMRIFGKAPAGQTVSDRLAALETYLMGKPQAGDAQQRLARLQEMLDGKPRPPAEPAADVAPVNHELFDVTKSQESDGKAVDGAGSGAGNGAADSPADTAVNQTVFSPTDEITAATPVAPVAAFADAQRKDPQSFVQAIRKMEERVFGGVSAKSSAEQSLDHLENFAMGKPQAGTLEQRLSRLEGVLNGSAASSTDSQKQAEAQGKAEASGKTEAPGKTEANGPAGAQEQTQTTDANNLAPAPAATSSGRTLRGRVNTLASTYSLAGITLRSNTLPSLVDVKPGSRAFKAGLCDNDRVLHAELGIDTLSLAVDHDGRKFMMEIPLTDPKVATKLKSDDVRLASGAAASAPGLRIKGTAAEDWKVLKQYNISVLLDVSGSMHSVEPEVGMSKSDWCRQEISSFAAEAEKLGSGFFDFGVFNGQYALFPNSNAALVAQELSTIPPGGGTNIAAPLQAVIDTRYSKAANKPFLIVVITDGLPGPGEQLDTLIVRAAQHARSAGDIKIIFLQIGRGPGQVLADFLDTQLVAEGAPYDIVSSIEWNDLSQIGLRSGLLAALSKPAGGQAVLDPERAAAFAQLKERLSRGPNFRFNNPTGIRNY